MRTNPDQLDLIIVGLGPVGGTAANLAGQLGLRTIAIDAGSDVHGLPRAIHFDADAMRIFQAAGLADDILAITRPARGSVHLGMDGNPIRDFRVPIHAGDLGWNPHYMFFQPQLDGLLRRKAADRETVEVRLGCRSVHVTNATDSVELLVESASGTSEVLRASYLLACDGASSATRAELCIEQFDYGFEEPWIIVDTIAPSEDLGPDHMMMFCDPSRPATYVPGPGRHRRWEFMILPGEDGAALRTPDAVRALIAPVAPWLDVSKAMLIRSAVYRFHALVATRWSVDRIFLGGDAVHQTPPFYGQGMCHGIRDVRNLLWKLRYVTMGKATPRLLDTYQIEREPHVRTIIEAAVMNGKYICTLDRDVAARRDAEYRQKMRTGADIGAFRSVIPGLSAGLLDPETSAASGAGALFPQPWVTADGHQPVPFDELLGPGFSAVTVDNAAAAEGWFTQQLGGRVVAAPAALATWFSERRCSWALVRPDRYVFGVASDADEFVGLTDRLREMLLGRGEFDLTSGSDRGEMTDAEPVGP